MIDIKEIEKNIDNLLKQYDKAIKNEKLTMAIEVSNKIENELSKLKSNEIKINSKELIL